MGSVDGSSHASTPGSVLASYVEVGRRHILFHILTVEPAIVHPISGLSADLAHSIIRLWCVLVVQLVKKDALFEKGSLSRLEGKFDQSRGPVFPLNESSNVIRARSDLYN
jgi:hypothetical protein